MTAPKPWEETWHVTANQHTAQVGSGLDTLAWFFPSKEGWIVPGEEIARERAKLAAQAPAMARLLSAVLDDAADCDMDDVLIANIKKILRDAGVCE